MNFTMSNLDGFDIGSIDIGNAIVNAIINGRYYSMPNSIALCKKIENKYEERDFDLFESMIVEIESKAVPNYKEEFYVGISATTKDNNERTEENNRKAESKRSMYLILSLLGYDTIKTAWDNGNKATEFERELDLLTALLPTRQVKQDKDKLVERLNGLHKITFKNIPGVGNVTVHLKIKRSFTVAEAYAAFVALVRDEETLKVKNEELLKTKLYINDLGGDSNDKVAFENGKILDEIKGEVFGINLYLDRIIDDVEQNIGYRFPSRHHLENILIKDRSKWHVTYNQKKHDITQYVDPHLEELAAKDVNELRMDLKKKLLQDVEKVYSIGGTKVVLKDYIIKENNKLEQPINITFPDNASTLNVEGIWILAKADLKVATKKEKETSQG